MLHRCKKWSDILKVASVGGGEIADLKSCHFSHFQFQLCHQGSLLKCHCTFYIWTIGQKAVSQIFERLSIEHFYQANVQMLSFKYPSGI